MSIDRQEQPSDTKLAARLVTIVRLLRYDGKAIRQRAELILQYEHAQSKDERANQRWHPTFLHMLVP
jgi:hypothetical protein